MTMDNALDDDLAALNLSDPEFIKYVMNKIGKKTANTTNATTKVWNKKVLRRLLTLGKDPRGWMGQIRGDDTMTIGSYNMWIMADAAKNILTGYSEAEEDAARIAYSSYQDYLKEEKPEYVRLPWDAAEEAVKKLFITMTKALHLSFQKGYIWR